MQEEPATKALQCALDDLYEVESWSFVGRECIMVYLLCASKYDLPLPMQDFSMLPPCVGAVVVRFMVSGAQGSVTDIR